MKKLSLLVIMVLIAVPLPGQIVIDGDMLDWEGVPPADVGGAAEEVGDMATGPEFDVQDLYITNDDSCVYFRIVMDPNGTFGDGRRNYTNPSILELWLETTLDTAGLTWGWWTLPLDYQVDMYSVIDPNINATEATIRKFHGYGAAPVWPDDYDSVGVALCAKNDNDNEIELAVPLAVINAGSDLRPFIYSVGDFIWAQEDYLPNHQNGTVPGYVINYNLFTGPAAILLKDQEIVSAITVDGDMSDWASMAPVDVAEVAEELGDMESGAEHDIKDIWVTSDSANIYFRIAIDPAATFTSQWTNHPGSDPAFQLFFDTNMEDTIGCGYGGFWIQAADAFVDLIAAYNPDNPSLEVNVYSYIADYAGAYEDWDSVGVAFAAVNDADNEIEVGIPRATLGAGKDVRFFIYSVMTENWDAEEYFPNDQTNEAGPSFVVNYNFVTGAAIVQRKGEPFGTGVKVAKTSGQPVAFALEQNYPNPFNPATHITYAITANVTVDLAVYNLAGQKIATLVHQYQTAGNYRVTWDGRMADGGTAASGLYFYRLKAGNHQQVKRMLLLK